jgi:hypothetical protein
MGTRRILLTILLVAAFVSTLVAFPQQKKQMSQQDMMAQMMKYAMPTKAHDFLKNYVGAWDVEVKSWMKPGDQPEMSKGTMKGELFFDGRFFMGNFDGMMMAQPFKGMQIIGYDLFQNKYVGFWIDNMSTCFYMTSGTLDGSGKVLTETGMWPNPMTGGANKVKIVTTHMDGKFRFEMFRTGPDGKEFKSMEIMYSRKI